MFNQFLTEGFLWLKCIYGRGNCGAVGVKFWWNCIEWAKPMLSTSREDLLLFGAIDDIIYCFFSTPWIIYGTELNVIGWLIILGLLFWLLGIVVILSLFMLFGLF